MIASLRGILTVREPGRVVVETGGVGYEVTVPLATYYCLPTVGNEVFLQIRQVVREDALLLYGFSEAVEKLAFDLLTQVQHVGPKHALSVLSVMSPEDLSDAIAREDIRKLDAVPGVGPKVAERIVRELRDKTGGLRDGARPRQSETAVAAAPASGAGVLMDEAVSALVNLAYKPVEARRAVDSVIAVNPDANLETLIRQSLAVLLGEK